MFGGRKLLIFQKPPVSITQLINPIAAAQPPSKAELQVLIPTRFVSTETASKYQRSKGANILSACEIYRQRKREQTGQYKMWQLPGWFCISVSWILLPIHFMWSFKERGGESALRELEENKLLTTGFSEPYSAVCD